MVADDLVRRVRLAVQPVGEALVQARAVGLRQAVVGDVAHEHVVEAERFLRAGDGADEAHADELEQVARERCRCIRRRELDEGAVRELAADDGGALEQRPLVRFEQVEPALEQRLHRGRHVVEHAGATLVRVREELLRE